MQSAGNVLTHRRWVSSGFVSAKAVIVEAGELLVPYTSVRTHPRCTRVSQIWQREEPTVDARSLSVTHAKHALLEDLLVE